MAFGIEFPPRCHCCQYAGLKAAQWVLEARDSKDPAKELRAKMLGFDDVFWHEKSCWEKYHCNELRGGFCDFKEKPRPQLRGEHLV